MDFKDGFKREMVRKLLLPGSKGAAGLAADIGVTSQTLYNWRDKYSQDHVTMSRNKRSGSLSAEFRAKTVLEFARLPQSEIGGWLRTKGLQSEHLKLWESELTTRNDAGHYKEENRLLKIRNKQIEKDLLKKDKALAELSAIIILQKKTAELFLKEEER